MIIAGTLEGGKTLPTDPETADEFDAALAAVAGKYRDGVPLTRGDLTRLVNASMRLMREVAR